MKWFSNNYVNEIHKKLDWSVRIIFIILFLISNYYTFTNESTGTYFNLIPWFVLIILLILSELLRAFMEWKYAENKRDYIATIAELLLGISIVILLILTNFFSLL